MAHIVGMFSVSGCCHRFGFSLKSHNECVRRLVRYSRFIPNLEKFQPTFQTCLQESGHPHLMYFCHAVGMIGHCSAHANSDPHTLCLHVVALVL